MNKSSRRTKLTLGIFVQYILALVIFTVAFFALFAAAYWFVGQFYWQYDDPVYQFLKFVQRFLVFFLAVPFIAGWGIITYFFMSRPLRYLDEVISASESLANPTDEQIILSDKLKSVQDELNRARETSLHNAQVAKENEQRKNDLIVYLAHDLKTPLTSVIGYLTLLRDEQEISPELREKYLSISLDKAERLEELINEFFEITRFNLSNIELQYSRINLTRMLEQLVFEFQPMLNEKQLQCTLTAAQDIMLKCDVNKLQRVFDNLLRNAVFYSFEGSEISITAEQSDLSTVVRFVNHGDTIPPEKLERLFEQFFRLDPSRGTNNGGAGLGLAIAKQITELHGGSITARSENELIEFTVTIPVL